MEERKMLMVLEGGANLPMSFLKLTLNKRSGNSNPRFNKKASHDYRRNLNNYHPRSWDMPSKSLPKLISSARPRRKGKQFIILLVKATPTCKYKYQLFDFYCKSSNN